MTILEFNATFTAIGKTVDHRRKRAISSPCAKTMRDYQIALDDMNRFLIRINEVQ